MDYSHTRNFYITIMAMFAIGIMAFILPLLTQRCSQSDGDSTYAGTRIASSQILYFHTPDEWECDDLVSHMVYVTVLRYDSLPSTVTVRNIDVPVSDFCNLHQFVWNDSLFTCNDVIFYDGDIDGFRVKSVCDSVDVAYLSTLIEYFFEQPSN